MGAGGGGWGISGSAGATGVGASFACTGLCSLKQASEQLELSAKPKDT